MTDIVTPEIRSKMMSGIKGKNTNPEMMIRSQLHRLGFRFRIHDKLLPGKPDIVLKKYNAVIFVHGCFWHRHECHLFKWPKSNSEFWRKKLNGNFRNDIKAMNELKKIGWRICIVWECSIKGARKDVEVVVDSVANWIVSEDKFLEISG